MDLRADRVQNEAMGCRAPWSRLLAVGVGLVLLSAPSVHASDATSPPASGSAPRHRLDLGLYGSPYGSAGQPPQGLRFEAWVDVEAPPERTLDETMALWWKHFDLGEPAVYGRDYNLRPDAQPNSVNLLPLFEKIYDKLKKRK